VIVCEDAGEALRDAAHIDSKGWHRDSIAQKGGFFS
jgi:hypothetical protein